MADKRRPVAPGCGGATPEKARRSGWAAATAAAALALASPCPAATAAGPQGVWMIEDEVAITVADCGAGALCGRVVWLRTPRCATARFAA